MALIKKQTFDTLFIQQLFTTSSIDTSRKVNGL